MTADIPDGPTFEAMYSGYCRDCETEYRPGAMIRYSSHYDHRVIVHADCEAAAIEPIEGAVCPKCFMRRALSGECGCDS